MIVFVFFPFFIEGQNKNKRRISLHCHAKMETTADQKQNVRERRKHMVTNEVYINIPITDSTVSPAG